MKPSRNTVLKKRQELRTLEGIKKGGIPKEYQIALDGMIKRLHYFLTRYDNH